MANTPRAIVSTASLTTRRTFCAHACQAASLLALGTVLPGCGGGGGSPTAPSGPPPAAQLPRISGGVQNDTVTVAIDAASSLASVGGAALVQSTAGMFLVARMSQDAFAAFTATCTHEACTITGFSNQTFVCPCHGSQFNTSGGVINGPAARALPQYATQFANDTLMISI
jgi:cytochrome b6-f complex iron-sulfur subunit